MEIKSTKRDPWGRALGKPPSRKHKRPINEIGDTFPVIDTFFNCRMKTSDDWYPNLEGPDGVMDEVQVGIIGWNQHYNKGETAYRIHVWGGDDCGMERDYKYEEITPQEMFELVMLFPEPLTKDWLEKQGFGPA